MTAARFGVPAGGCLPPVGTGVCLDTRSASDAAGWPGTTRWTAGERFSCCPGRAAQLCEMCGRHGQLAVRYDIARRRAQAYSEAQRLFFTRDTPTSRPQRSEQALGGGPGTLDAKMDAGELTHGSAVRVRKAPLQRRKPTPDGKVERCSEGEAQGVVDSRGRPGTRHPSGHGKEVHGSSEPAHEARSGRIGAICYHREQYK